MSDIGILNSPSDIAFLVLLFCGPALPVGAIVGALVWRRRRVAGALIGAALGVVLCAIGWGVIAGVFS